MTRRFLLGLTAAAALVAQRIPPANFSGTIHGVSKKHIVLETAEGNLLDFDVNAQTRVLRGKSKITIEDLQTGDSVTIEAKQEPSSRQTFLLALTITATEKPKD